ncbi:MAG: hypothetical protein DRJ40_01460 [Thermoprotei archaeon]|nr:MAG: hypothetical protein DRJ40_01460 [Thermoprotei archaeon]
MTWGKYLSILLVLLIVLPTIPVSIPAVEARAEVEVSVTAKTLVSIAERAVTYLEHLVTRVVTVNVTTTEIEHLKYVVVELKKLVERAKEELDRGNYTGAVAIARSVISRVRAELPKALKLLRGEEKKNFIARVEEEVESGRVRALEKLVKVLERFSRRYPVITVNVTTAKKLLQEKKLEKVEHVIRCTLKHLHRYVMRKVAPGRILNMTRSTQLLLIKNLEAVNKTLPLEKKARGILVAIERINRTIQRLTTVVAKLREVNASPVAISAIEMTIEHLKGVMEHLKTVYGMISAGLPIKSILPRVIKELRRGINVTTVPVTKSEVKAYLKYVEELMSRIDELLSQAKELGIEIDRKLLAEVETLRARVKEVLENPEAVSTTDLLLMVKKLRNIEFRLMLEIHQYSRKHVMKLLHGVEGEVSKLGTELKLIEKLCLERKELKPYLHEVSELVAELDAAKSLLAKVRSVAKENPEKAKELINVLIAKVQELRERIKQLLSKLKEEVLEILEKLREDIKELIDELTKQMEELPIPESTKEKIRKLLARAEELLSRADEVKKLLEKDIASALKMITEMEEEVQEISKEMKEVTKGGKGPERIPVKPGPP